MWIIWNPKYVDENESQNKIKYTSNKTQWTEKIRDYKCKVN